MFIEDILKNYMYISTNDNNLPDHISLLQGDIVVAILSNYMVDIDWLMHGKFLWIK